MDQNNLKQIRDGLANIVQKNEFGESIVGAIAARSVIRILPFLAGENGAWMFESRGALHVRNIWHTALFGLRADKTPDNDSVAISMSLGNAISNITSYQGVRQNVGAATYIANATNAVLSASLGSTADSKIDRAIEAINQSIVIFNDGNMAIDEVLQDIKAIQHCGVSENGAFSFPLWSSTHEIVLVKSFKLFEDALAIADMVLYKQQFKALLDGQVISDEEIMETLTTNRSNSQRSELASYKATNDCEQSKKADSLSCT